MRNIFIYETAFRSFMARMNLENRLFMPLSEPCSSGWSAAGEGRPGKDAFSRYEPWENPGLLCRCDALLLRRKSVRLERSFGRLERRVSLVCEDDGEELSVEHGDLDMLLGGLTAASFDVQYR